MQKYEEEKTLTNPVILLALFVPEILLSSFFVTVLRSEEMGILVVGYKGYPQLTANINE